MSGSYIRASFSRHFDPRLAERDDHYIKMASKGKMQRLTNLGISFAFWDQEQVTWSPHSTF